MNVKEKFTKLKQSMDRWLWKLVGKENETRTPIQAVGMYVKEKFPKVRENVDRWLWKLVGKENDILFHALRIVLASSSCPFSSFLLSGSLPLYGRRS